MTQGTLGDNSERSLLEIEVRLFNSVARYANRAGHVRRLALPAGTSVGELADLLEIPRQVVHLVMVNGRDITPGLVGAQVRRGYQVEHGDVIAFSGPVPYSYGYGSPVV